MLGVRDNSNQRLNVLLSTGEQIWADHLPRLLEPQGVHAIRVSDVDQALDVIEHHRIHAAVIETGGDRNRQGLKLLQVIRRMSPTPPAVLVRGRLFDRRDDNRLLADALKFNAFSVLDQPVHLEQILDTLRRLLERYYGGQWPTASQS